MLKMSQVLSVVFLTAFIMPPLYSQEDNCHSLVDTGLYFTAYQCFNESQKLSLRNKIYWDINNKKLPRILILYQTGFVEWAQGDYMLGRKKLIQFISLAQLDGGVEYEKKIIEVKDILSDLKKTHAPAPFYQEPALIKKPAKTMKIKERHKKVKQVITIDKTESIRNLIHKAKLAKANGQYSLAKNLYNAAEKLNPDSPLLRSLMDDLEKEMTAGEGG